MSQSGRDQDAAPRKDRQKVPRVKPELIEWGAKWARAAKVSYTDDEMYGMSGGEADARQEMDDERREEDEALEDFDKLSARCDSIKHNLEILIGAKGAEVLPNGSAATERAKVLSLADAIRADLGNTKPDEANEKIGQIEAILQTREACNDLKQKLERLVGPPGGLIVPEGASDQEAGQIRELAGSVAGDLAEAKLDDAREGFHSLETLTEQVQYAATQRRALTEQVVTLRSTASGIKGLTNGDALDLQEAEAQALRMIATAGAEQAKAAVDALRATVARAKDAVAERADLTTEVEALSKAYRASKKLTKEEYAELTLARTSATEAIKSGDVGAARRAVQQFSETLDRIQSDTRAKTLLARLKYVLGMKDKQTSQEVYQECLAADVKFDPTLKLELRKAGLLESNTKFVPDYTIDLSKQHARERHTREGIWEAKKLTTATEGAYVAIFYTLADMNTALDSAPKAKSQWYSSGGGRWDADLNGVHYQGFPAGDTMPLDTCFPKRGRAGRQYPIPKVQEALNAVLARKGTFEDFCDELDRM